MGCPASAPRRTERVRSERSARHTRSRTARLGAPSGTVHSEIRPMLDHRRSGPRRHQASSIRASGHRTLTHPNEDVFGQDTRHPGRCGTLSLVVSCNTGRTRDQLCHPVPYEDRYTSGMLLNARVKKTCCREGRR